jgi:hypothetical protein
MSFRSNTHAVANRYAYAAGHDADSHGHAVGANTHTVGTNADPVRYADWDTFTVTDGECNTDWHACASDTHAAHAAYRDADGSDIYHCANHHGASYKGTTCGRASPAKCGYRFQRW